MDKLWRWFERLVPPFPRDEAAPPPRGLWRFIFFYTRGMWKFLILTGILTSLMAAGEALFFICLGLIVDWTAHSSPDVFFAEHKLELGIMLLLAAVFLPSASLLHSLILRQTISGNYPMRIRWLVHQHMLAQSMAFFTDEFAGRIANKVMQTALAVRTSVIKLSDVATHMVVYMAAMIWMLAGADPLLCLPLIVWVTLYCATIAYFVPRLRRRAQSQADTRSDMVGRIVDSYVNIATVKLFGGKGREARYARSGMEGYLRSEYRAMRVLTLYDLSVQLLNYALLISLTTLALVLWSSGLVSPGSIAVAMAIAIRIVNMSRWMMWEVGSIFENIGTVYDGMNTISRPVTVKDCEHPEHLPEKISGHIEFSHVRFAYGSGHEVFSDLNLEIKPGERVGIVGHSGAGKSTLVNLLLRFYEVGGGEIRLDGVRIDALPQDELRDCFAMVTQEPSLMHRTVGENIAYGTAQKDTDDVRRAAEVTDALSFIENLSDYRGGHGFTTMVGERGVKLSGGQRQKIALARVVLKNAPILILDEATAALDSESEHIITENLSQVMTGRTVIAIAHRLSTLLRMTRIIVIDGGVVAESGTHEELLARGGIYRRLWDRQSGGFIGS